MDVDNSGMQYLKQHLGNGDRVIILSASISDWIKPWAGSVGVEEVVSTEAEVSEDGVLTGRFSTPNCHGREKVERIQAMIEDRTGCHIYAYGDSPSDKYILGYADQGIMLNKK